MAYSGAVQVIHMHTMTSAQSIVALDAGLDFSASGADMFVLYVPTPLMVYQFGVFVTESFGAGDLTALTLQSALMTVGTDTLLTTLDFDSILLFSGDGNSPAATVSTGAEDIVAGDVAYARHQDFPVLVEGPRVLTVANTTSGQAGEGIPFIIARYQGPDLRPARVWTRA